MKFSNRAIEMQYSSVRKLIPYALAAEKKGIKVHRLNIGQPDIETPELFFDGIKNVEEKVIKYADSRGISKLINTFLEIYNTRYNYNLLSEDVVVTQGASEGITFALMALCDEGDEVLIPEPFYSNYKSFIDFAGAKIVPIKTDINNDFSLPSKEKIKELISPKTKAILFSNPCNPTGKVYSEDEVKMLGEIAVENELFIISDEVYREFIYDENIKHFSMMNFKEFSQNFCMIESVSKHYSACGARIGFIFSKNKKFMEYINKFCQARLAVSTVDQYGAEKLIRIQKEYFSELRKIYYRRMKEIVKGLNEIEGVKCPEPKGAIYAFAKLPVENAEDFCKWLLTDFSLDNETVMLAPGIGFYSTPNLGTQEVRFSFCVSDEEIRKAMIILRKGLEKYKNK